jgi:hypothetical protein
LRAAALLLLLCSCAVVQTIDTALDCRAICNRYQSCFDSAYDVDGCESRCRGHASDDREYRKKADDCDHCIANKSCAKASFSCLQECVGVVP